MEDKSAFLINLKTTQFFLYNNDLFAELEKALAGCQSHSYSRIILRQECILYDKVEAEDTDLLDHLRHKISRLRSILKQISACEIPWCFLGFFDCFDTYWELALACHFRAWFTVNSLHGFLQLKAQSFPYGGLLENEKNSSFGNYEKWLENPILDSEACYKQKLIHFFSFQKISENFIEEWIFSKTKNFNPLKSVRENSALTIPLNRIVAMEKKILGRQWLKDEATSTLQLIKNLFAARKWFEDSGRFQEMLTFFLAKRSVHLALQTSTFPIAREKKHTNLICILLTEQLVPIWLLTDSTSLIFFDSNTERLGENLQRLYLRLDQIVGSNRAVKIWEKMAWYSGKEPIPGSILLTFPTQKRIEIKCAERQYNLAILQNKSMTNSQVCLFAGATRKIVDKDFGFFSGQIICTTNDKLQCFEIKCLIKLLLFDEIMFLSTLPGLELDKIFDSLKSWGRSSSLEYWNFFLQGEKETISKLAYTEFRKIFKNQTIFSWTSIKSGLEQLSRKNTDAAKNKEQVLLLGGHFTFFILALAKSHQFEALEMSRDDLEQLIRYSLKVPPSIRPFSLLYKQVGARRLKLYIDEFWPFLS